MPNFPEVATSEKLGISERAEFCGFKFYGSTV